MRRHVLGYYMLTLEQAMLLAFTDLEETFQCNWRSGKGSRDNLLKAFSQKEVPIHEYLGYGGSDGLRHAFGRAIPKNDKPHNEKWDIWLLSRIGLTYCRICKQVHEDFDPFCKEPAVDRSYIREEVSEFICEYLSKNPCILCGETDIRVLEFDHITPEDKKFNIGDRSSRSYDTVLLEMRKCRVLCANCHRRHTSITQGHYKHKYFTELMH